MQKIGKSEGKKSVIGVKKQIVEMGGKISFSEAGRE
jgi:hypothetical protein